MANLILFLLLLCTSAFADGDVNNGGIFNKGLLLTTADGTTSVKAKSVVVSNGTLTDNGDGSATLTTGGGTSGSSLTLTSVKTSNYSANANEFIPCDISGGSFTVTLPNAPADGTRVVAKVITPGTNMVLTFSTSGADVFTKVGGNTSLYMTLSGETNQVQYDASTKIWYIISTAAPSNFQIGFPGIDAVTPLLSSDVSFDTTSLILTVTPPLGYFNYYVDGSGAVTRVRKTGAVTFPAITNTSGFWYFYFNSSGVAVSTQTPWTGADFSSIATVYRILWNASLAGSSRDVAEYIEMHQNTISSSDHQWKHMNTGTIWLSGFDIATNAIASGTPNADGRNAVIGITGGSNMDDNLPYSITNDTTVAQWHQNLGTTVTASLNATNSGLFKVFVQDGSGQVSFLPATRFPFPWNSSNNRPQFITSTGTTTDVTNNDFLVEFVYSTQNPRAGEALKVISADTQFTSLANAQAYTWTTLNSVYTLFYFDHEIRPLYRLIYEVKHSAAGAFNVGTKYAALRQVDDLRVSQVTSTAAAAGSIAATSVTVAPTGSITSTNAQSAFAELDADKVAYTNGTSIDTAGNITAGRIANVIQVDGIHFARTCTGINAATSSAVAGDTVFLTNGAYTADVLCALNKASVNYKGASREGVIITAANALNAHAVQINAANVRLSNVTIDGNKTNQGTPANENSYYGLNVLSSPDSWVSNVLVKNTAGGCFRSNLSPRLHMRDIEYQACGQAGLAGNTYGAGFQINSSPYLDIDGAIGYDSLGNGLFFYAATAPDYNHYFNIRNVKISYVRTNQGAGVMWNQFTTPNADYGMMTDAYIYGMPNSANGINGILTSGIGNILTDLSIYGVSGVGFEFNGSTNTKVHNLKVKQVGTGSDAQGIYFSGSGNGVYGFSVDDHIQHAVVFADGAIYGDLQSGSIGNALTTSADRSAIRILGNNNTIKIADVSIRDTTGNTKYGIDATGSNLYNIVATGMQYQGMATANTSGLPTVANAGTFEVDGNMLVSGGFTISGAATFNKGIYLPSAVASPTTNALYNNAGVLTFNGTAVGGGGSSQWTGTNPISFGGNVGIGSVSPSVSLDVTGAIRGGSISVGTSAPTSPQTGQGWYDTSTASTLSTLFVSGNVGIATTSPSFSLDVGGGAVISGANTVANSARVAGNLEVDGTLYASNVYVKLSNTQASGTGGGTMTASSWTTNPLNTKDSDINNIATLTAGQFTLPKGTYRARAESVFYYGGVVQSRIYNITGSAVVLTGSNGVSTTSSNYPTTFSHIYGTFTLSATAVLALQYYGSNAGVLGAAMSLGTNEVYSQLELEKIK